MMLVIALAQQTAPNTIYVQQAGGIPEWIKILITGLSGTVLGIVGAVAMEYIKPLIQKRTIQRQLQAELEDNLAITWTLENRLEEVRKSPDESSRKLVLVACRDMLSFVNGERFAFYFENQRSLIFEITCFDHLKKFYSVVKIAAELSPDTEDYFSAFSKILATGSNWGHYYRLNNVILTDVNFERAKRMYAWRLDMAKSQLSDASDPETDP